MIFIYIKCIYLFIFLEKSGLVCAAWDLTHVHGLMCYEYDEQAQFRFCDAITFLQIGGGMGKKNVTDGE